MPGIVPAQTVPEGGSEEYGSYLLRRPLLAIYIYARWIHIISEQIFLFKENNLRFFLLRCSRIFPHIVISAARQNICPAEEKTTWQHIGRLSTTVSNPDDLHTEWWLENEIRFCLYDKSLTYCSAQTKCNLANFITHIMSHSLWMSPLKNH